MPRLVSPPTRGARHRAAIVRALRGTGLGEAGVEAIGDRREKLTAGLWALALGPLICMVGTLVGTVLMNVVVSATLRPGATAP